MLGVDVPGCGRRYLVAETTAKSGIGKIDASQADFSKWLVVDVGEETAARGGGTAARVIVFMQGG